MEVSNRDCSDDMSSTDVNTGRRKRGRYLGILALLVAAGYLLILLFVGQEKRSIQLKDGTTLNLRAVAYGKHHDPQITPSWLLKLDEALPRRLQGKLAPHRNGDIAEDWIEDWICHDSLKMSPFGLDKNVPFRETPQRYVRQSTQH